VTPWEHTLDAVRRRWPKALVRVTMTKPSGDDAFVAAVVQLTRSGPGAEEEPVALGGSEVDALRALCTRLKGGPA
jgi:hypothetical protein